MAAPALTRPGMLPPGGSVLRGLDFWEVPFPLMLSPGWTENSKLGFNQNYYLNITDKDRSV